MSTRTRRRARADEPLEEAAGSLTHDLLEDVTDDDIEAFLRAREAEEQKPGFWNLPTAAGLATIGIGAAYLLQELGLFASGFDFSAFLGPWLVGVLIILLGFGVLSWSPERARRRRRQREQAAREARAQAALRDRPPPLPERPGRTAEQQAAAHRSRHAPRRVFAKSRRNRKIAGVCGGIGEYLGIDPTLVRIAFVIALIASGSFAIPVYLLLAWLMPSAERVARERLAAEDEHVIVIR